MNNIPNGIISPNYEEKNSFVVILVIAIFLVVILGVTAVCIRRGYAGGQIIAQPWN